MKNITKFILIITFFLIMLLGLIIIDLFVDRDSIVYVTFLYAVLVRILQDIIKEYIIL